MTQLEAIKTYNKAVNNLTGYIAVLPCSDSWTTEQLSKLHHYALSVRAALEEYQNTTIDK